MVVNGFYLLKYNIGTQIAVETDNFVKKSWMDWRLLDSKEGF